MISSKVDPRSVINYGTNIIAPSKVQDIYHKANVYFQKYKQERIIYRTFYISKGFDIVDGKGKIIEHVCKGVREKHPAQRDDSTKWRRIDYLPKQWRKDLIPLTKSLGWAVNPKNLYGFLPAISVRDAAEQIWKANTVVEVDAKDAFHQMTRSEMIDIMRRDLDWNKNLSEWFAKLCAPKGVAQMGNPVVPILFNIKISKILRKVNERLRRANIVSFGISYADDICFLLDEEVAPRKEIDTIECIIGNYLRLNKKKTKIHHKRSGFRKLGLSITHKGVTSYHKYKRMHMLHKCWLTKDYVIKAKNNHRWDNRSFEQNNIWGHMEWISYQDKPNDREARKQDKLKLCRKFDVEYVPKLIVRDENGDIVR